MRWKTPPDKGLVEISIKNGIEGPEFEVNDFGVGITSENQHLIFENYFVASETIEYSSRNRYDFNAGGKGFDLLRMRIFSERFNFQINMRTKRCEYIKSSSYHCPGDIDKCKYCRTNHDCLDSGGNNHGCSVPEGNLDYNLRRQVLMSSLSLFPM